MDADHERGTRVERAACRAAVGLPPGPGRRARSRSPTPVGEPAAPLRIAHSCRLCPIRKRDHMSGVDPLTQRAVTPVPQHRDAAHGVHPAHPPERKQARDHHAQPNPGT